VRVPVLTAAVAIAMSGFATSALYRAVTDRLDLPATALSVLASAQGAGSILGGLVVGRLLSRVGPVAVAAWGAALFAAGCLVQCVSWWPALIAASVTVGVGLPWTLVAGITAVQTGVPAALLGRAAATSTTVMFAPNALAIPLGAAAVHLGSRPPLLTAAVLCLTAAALAGRRAAANRPAAADRPAAAGRPGRD
jgi:MFS family permease